MKRLLPFLPLIFLLGWQCAPTPESKKGGLKFSISFTPEMSDQAQDGRLMLLLANNDKSEPRNQINFGLTTQLAFGVDVEGMKPGQEIVLDESSFGFPIRNVNNIPAGEYYVQALINRYETFNLKNGKSVKLPPDQGEGQHWNSKPGNFYSRPFKVKIDATQKEPIQLAPTNPRSLCPTTSMAASNSRR